MQENIASLINHPITIKPSFDTSLTTWFLLDKVRGKQTLNALYQQTDSGIIAQINYLLAQTPHESLLEVSPLLIKLSHTKLNDNFYQQLHQERSGLFIQSNDNILPHLQYLFTMQSEIQGQVYVRYFDPIYWSSLQVGLSEKQQPQLWGNMLKVHTLAPASTPEYLAFNEWTRPVNLSATLYQTPETLIQLNEQFYALSDDIKLFYLVLGPILDKKKNTLSGEQLNCLLLNVKSLNAQGIERIDYLQRLFNACVSYNNLTSEPSIAPILANNSLYEYEKVRQIEQAIHTMHTEESTY